MLNISVTLRKYPSKLKLSKITPIFKSGEDNGANNYRPVYPYYLTLTEFLKR